ncbi:MAG: HD domain-containing protein [Proteobacteria bacterium]|nr:HD domain-containing protein [Pseudomonadota bacterium]MBU1711328.1 HD domain-containing protein [Pseudomonadota bacterium]
MVTQKNIYWTFGRDYNGQLLYGAYSDELKRKITDYIAQYLALDKINAPVIPYISAWHESDEEIWYEYTGIELNRMLGCDRDKIPETLKNSIIDRIIYKSPTGPPSVTKEITRRHQLDSSRTSIRETSKKEKTIDAVYKILTPYNGMIWLKDQAIIEVFPADGIYLSRGFLIDVTKEMRAEEILKKAEGELKRHRDHLEDLVRDRTKRLWKSQLEILSRLARAAEFRDSSTGDHITKMSRYCSVLGQAAGLRKNVNHLLFHAAPMHDVGKIGITDSILLKSGSLDPIEFEQMKTHCTIGAKLLSGQNSNLFRVARSIALSHHERWDGTGYPHGLKRDTIPMAGRLAAVCDVFDALTSKRPYKQAWSFNKAVAELHKQKGSHFDPMLVDLFIHNLPAIKRIHAEH